MQDCPSELPTRRMVTALDAVSVLQRVLYAKGQDTMDGLILQAASENVAKMMKKVTGRMGIDKPSAQMIDATAKKDKDKAVKSLTRNLAKCAHSNPIIAADFIISHVSCRIPIFSDAFPVRWSAHLSFETQAEMYA